MYAHHTSTLLHRVEAAQVSGSKSLGPNFDQQQLMFASNALSTAQREPNERYTKRHKTQDTPARRHVERIDVRYNLPNFNSDSSSRFGITLTAVS